MIIDKTKEKWWEELQYQCPRCKKYQCFKFEREDDKFYYKKCSECGFERSSEIVWGEWKVKNGKTYLTSNSISEPVEVNLIKIGKGLKIVPVEKTKILL